MILGLSRSNRQSAPTGSPVNRDMAGVKNEKRDRDKGVDRGGG
jgi:hypothetical protein